MRILIADDDSGVQAAYRVALQNFVEGTGREALLALESDLFADDDASRTASSVGGTYEITFCSQGEEAVAAVETSLRQTQPYQLIFLDMRMPPGITGKETAARIRALDPEIFIVMVTGYSDASPRDVAEVAGPMHRIYYLAKPFDGEEVRQMARALSAQWQLERDLAAAHSSLEEKVAHLEKANADLAISEARARYIGLHDALTGAPNRAAFFAALMERNQSSPVPYAVAILDLDRFKHVNDTLGHAAGDELIREVWSRLQTALPPQAMAARLGGDEFGLLLAGNSAADPENACKVIIAACSQDFVLLGHSTTVGASIGVAPSLAGGELDTADIVRRADLALYAAKRSGRGRVYVYEDSLDASAKFRLRVEAGLRRAIAQNELSLAFQPIVSQQTLEVVGFEALCRWHSSEFGIVPPSVFIPIAEESALIHEVSAWVVPKAMAACATWPDQYVSINFSPRQFHRVDIVDQLIGAAQTAGLRPQRVQIEITESTLFHDVDAAAAVLDRLQQLGFRVALDDFGTGYSSLLNLQSLNVDCIKLDQSFVSALGRTGKAAAIVQSITHLAKSLGLGVIAEGVETPFQQQALRVAGAPHMQGYLFGRPESERDAHARALDEHDAAQRLRSAMR